MDRLPDPSNKDQYNVIIRKLLEEIEKLKHIPQARVENVYDMNNNEKIQSIMEYLKYRKRKVKELSTRNDQLVLECQEAEKLLAQRVESLQKDPSVQHALTKNIRIKAASHQAQTELHCMKNHIENLTSEVDTIENQTKNDIFNRNSDIVKSLASQHKRVLQLLTTNSTCHEKIKAGSLNRKEKSLNDSGELLERIEAARVKLIKDTSTTVTQPKKDVHSQELLDAKNEMSPLSLISTVQFIKEIFEAMQSISVLEKESVVQLCSEIRETLENLVEKWGSSLSDQDIQVPTDVPVYHDGIDNVIQSIDAIRLHFQEKEHSFIKEQELKLKSKLVAADNIDSEVHRTIDSVEERGLLTTIGDSFTVSDISFREWSEKLLK
ncbi:unnamed protein product [Mucor hiemalis]